MARCASHLSAYSVLSGFIFTAITLILTRHPEPSQIKVQIVLLVLTITLNAFLLLVARQLALTDFCVRIAPKLPNAWIRWGAFYGFLPLAGMVLFSGSVVLMFYLWDLLYLALVTTAMAVVTTIFTYISMLGPAAEFVEENPWIRK